MRFLVLLLSASLLGGCATGYTDGSNPLAITGGYYDEPGPGKLTTVGFHGNGYTDGDTVRRYLLRRASEVTLEQDHTHFLAFSSLPEAAAMRPVGEDLGVHSIGGKPFRVIYILPLDATQPGALDAAAVLARVTAPEAE